MMTVAPADPGYSARAMSATAWSKTPTLPVSIERLRPTDVLSGVRVMASGRDGALAPARLTFATPVRMAASDGRSKQRAEAALLRLVERVVERLRRVLEFFDVGGPGLQAVG